MAYGLSLDASKSHSPFDSLHFEESEIPLPSVVIQRAPLVSPVLASLDPPLLSGTWRALAEYVPSSEAPAEASAQENPKPTPPQAPSKVDWSDVLGWTLSAASMGVGIYLIKHGHERQDSNSEGLGVGLSSAGATWALAEGIHRGFVDGQRPDRRGSLLVLSLGSGTAIGLLTRYTNRPAPLLPRSAFAGNESGGNSLNGKNPTSEFGP